MLIVSLIDDSAVIKHILSHPDLLEHCMRAITTGSVCLNTAQNRWFSLILYSQRLEQTPETIFYSALDISTRISNNAGHEMQDYVG